MTKPPRKRLRISYCFPYTKIFLHRHAHRNALLCKITGKYANFSVLSIRFKNIVAARRARRAPAPGGRGRDRGRGHDFRVFSTELETREPRASAIFPCIRCHSSNFYSTSAVKRDFDTHSNADNFSKRVFTRKGCSNVVIRTINIYVSMCLIFFSPNMGEARITFFRRKC